MSLRAVPAVAFHQVSKRFGRVEALAAVSLEARQGETLALLGPNGSGKTTLLRVLLGLVRPDSGAVSVYGRDALKDGWRSRECLAYAPQRPAFPDGLSVLEVVDFYRRLRALPAARCAAVLDEVGLGADRDVLARDLSGGMSQRLALAVALLPATPLVVFDEPTASLDPKGVLRFRETAKRLRREGRTVLFTTHLLGDVETVADRVAVLVGGRLVLHATLEEFCRSGSGRNLEDVYLDIGGAGEGQS